MKNKLIILCLLICCILTGCTVDGDRINTVCKDTPTCTYVYNANGDFYFKDKTTGDFNSAVPGGLVNKPILLLTPSEGSYTLTEDLPNKYACTFDDFNNYLNYLIVNDNISYTIECVDYKSVELTVCCNTYSMKCFYTNNGFLRLYCVDSAGNPITPPYINEEE